MGRVGAGAGWGGGEGWDWVCGWREGSPIYIDVEHQIQNKYRAEDRNMVAGFSTTVKTRPLVIAKMEEYTREKMVKLYSWLHPLDSCSEEDSGETEIDNPTEE